MREKFMLVVFGLCLVALFFLPDNIEKVTAYTPPPFSKLRVSTGKVEFRPLWKSGGGELVLHVEKNKLVLSCAPPNREQGFPCHYKKNGTLDFRSDVVGRQGTAWWEPVSGSVDGRLYQLEVDGKIFIRFEDMAEQYSASFKKTKSSEK
ncbi:hypothetical protein [Massilia niastensis]|uniref:hypothetical protein n=1 Tax=Massilia niastensis TaxID=544911 RepID=UPI0012EC28E5|nr:hypothetical protein [Massilia niastensis]